MGDTASRSRTALSATAAAVAVVGVLLVLLTWAAAIGPDELVRGDGPQVAPRSDVVTPTATPPPAAAGRSSEDRAREAPPRGMPLLGTLLLVVGCLGLLVLVVVVGRRLWRLLAEREVAEADPDETDFVPLTPQAAAEELAAEAEQAEQLLAEGSPRNAIVRCWARFELAAGRTGLARRDWETSAELTLRFFDAVEADTEPVQRLAVLYREARFSDHEVTEADRDDAVRALAEIHRSLRGARR